MKEPDQIDMMTETDLRAELRKQIKAIEALKDDMGGEISAMHAVIDEKTKEIEKFEKQHAEFATMMASKHNAQEKEIERLKQAIAIKYKEIKGLSNLLIGLGECDGDAKELMQRQQDHITLLSKQNDLLIKFLESEELVEASQHWIALNSGGLTHD